MKNKLSLTEDFLPGEEEARDLFDIPEGPDPETLEGQGWEYVASKDVYDEDGFRDVYYWYKKDGNNRFFFSSDVDYGDPEYFDWETDGEEAAQEWFDSYGEDEDDLTLVDNREAAILGKGDDPGFDEYDKVDEAVNISDEEDSTDTLDDIAAWLEKVNQPTYRGARIPSYNADAINESEFPDNMRAKYYEARVTRDGRIAFLWITEEPFTETDVDVFKKELDRYFTRIIDNSNYEGPIHVDVTVECRDGDEWGYSKFTLSHPDDQLEESIDSAEKATKEDSKKADESFNNSSSSYYLTTVGDMIDGSVGNVDDEDIDKDLKFWRTVARTFNFVPGADNVAVLIADGEYDPEYYYPSWTNEPRAIAKKYPNAVFYDVPFFCVKEVKNGKMFLYFDGEESAKKYVDLIDSGIDFEDQSNFDNLDESYNKTVKESLDDDDIDIDTESERWEDIYEYGDDADEYDDFELAGIYGGDLTYCPICGRRLQYDEDGDSFCPKCEKSAWDLAQERRKRDKSESVDSSDDLSDEEMNEACGSNIETEENLDECDYNNLEDDPAVDVSDLRAPADPHEKEKLQEFGPAAAAIVSAVAPVVADKVLDKILPENAPAATVDETEVQGAGEEDDIDESVLNIL